MENIQVTFGKNLRREIDRKHLKYGDAADLFEISLSFLNQVMKGTNAPSLEVFHRIVEKLHVSPEALMYGDSKPVQPKPLDPADLVSAAQIAAALTELNKKFETMKPANESIARIAARLTALDDSQLNHVNGFIDDLLARTPLQASHSKVR